MLSNSGMGKISTNSQQLYLGRWLDTSTGKIRLLPTASAKYINPASRPEKQAYLEARMINKWN